MGDTARMTADLHPLIDATVGDRVADQDRDFSEAQAHVRSAPRDLGVVHAIVRRPSVESRQVVAEAMLDEDDGLVGDNWRARGSSSTPDGSANREAQLAIMSTRVLEAIEPDPARWALAGDQLLVDIDLSIEHLPPGTRLLIGGAELMISEKPHTGCAKFSARFGSDALRWINTVEGRELRLRGVNARVVRGGLVRVGDEIRRA
jgi:hypothetical protein